MTSAGTLVPGKTIENFVISQNQHGKPSDFLLAQSA
jgi:hypothetical protein